MEQHLTFGGKCLIFSGKHLVFGDGTPVDPLAQWYGSYMGISVDTNITSMYRRYFPGHFAISKAETDGDVLYRPATTVQRTLETAGSSDETHFYESGYIVNDDILKINIANSGEYHCFIKNTTISTLPGLSGIGYTLAEASETELTPSSSTIFFKDTANMGMYQYIGIYGLPGVTMEQVKTPCDYLYVQYINEDIASGIYTVKVTEYLASDNSNTNYTLTYNTSTGYFEEASMLLYLKMLDSDTILFECKYSEYEFVHTYHRTLITP